MIGMVLNLIGALCLFLYGMKIMSEGIQKAAGSRLQQVLNYITNNRFSAVLTGFVITTLVQSSSATTVMVVSFANAALLSLQQAIGIIMGANIGTTVTTWIVSFLGFKFKIAALALPIIGIGFPFFFSKEKRKREFGEILVGFGILFLGLAFLKESVPDIKHNPEILAFLQNYTNLGFVSYLIFIAVGTVLTVVVQSSSAAMAITVTMAYKGWIDFPTATAIVLGENIGTTITAYLASIGTSLNAKRAARAHLFFNLFGVIWMTFAFKHFLKFILHIAPWDTSIDHNLPLNLSLFHTVFNLSNTLIFIPFVPQFTALIKRMIPGTEKELPGRYKLQYITSGVQNTPQFNLVTARNEISQMAHITKDMFNRFLDVFFHPNQKKGDDVEKIKQMEDYTDQMQEELSKFLVRCSNEPLTENNLNNINRLMRITNELENIADSCLKLIILTQKKYERRIILHEKAFEEIKKFADLVLEFINFYLINELQHIPKRDLDIAYRLENKINQSRDTLKKAAQKRLQDGANVKSEILFIDILKNFEHIGDNALNIAQALRNMS